MDKITIGDQELTVEEAQELVEKGRYAKEQEEKYNTDFPSAWSAYGKSQNENKEMRDRLKRAEDELEKIRTTISPQKETPPSGLTKDQLEELGYVKRDDVEKSYVKKDEIDTLVDTKIKTDREAQRIVSRMEELSSTINGEDGRPEFESQKILDYMIKHEKLDPEEAYNEMYKSEIEEWKQKQLDGKKPSGMGVLNNPGSTRKEPVNPEIVRDNLGPSIREALSEGSAKV